MFFGFYRLYSLSYAFHSQCLSNAYEILCNSIKNLNNALFIHPHEYSGNRSIILIQKLNAEDKRVMEMKERQGRKKKERMEKTRCGAYGGGNIVLQLNMAHFIPIYPSSMKRKWGVFPWNNWYLFEIISVFGAAPWLPNNRWFINCHLENQNEKWPTFGSIPFTTWILNSWTISLSWLPILSLSLSLFLFLIPFE